MIFNTTPHIAAAALDGQGVAYLPEEEFAPYIEEGQLVRVLADWCPWFSGYHLYYPSRCLPSPAFKLILDALRVDQRSRQAGASQACRIARAAQTGAPNMLRGAVDSRPE